MENKPKHTLLVESNELINTVKLYTASSIGLGLVIAIMIYIIYVAFSLHFYIAIVPVGILVYILVGILVQNETKLRVIGVNVGKTEIQFYDDKLVVIAFVDSEDKSYEIKYIDIKSGELNVHCLRKLMYIDLILKVDNHAFDRTTFGTKSSIADKVGTELVTLCIGGTDSMEELIHNFKKYARTNLEVHNKNYTIYRIFRKISIK